MPNKHTPVLFGVTVDPEAMLRIEHVSPPGEHLLVGPSGKPRMLLHSGVRPLELEMVLAVAGVVSLVSQDSLKRCCFCGATQYRRHNFKPCQVIENPRLPEVDGKSVRIFLPRKANQPRWWKCGLIRRMIVTPSYHEPTGWVHIWPETCCPTPHCDGETWQVPLGRDGYRKFGPVRWAIIRLACKLMPQTFRMH